MNVQMNVLLEQSEYLLSNTTINFKRFLFNEIKWNNRLVDLFNIVDRRNSLCY